MWKEAVPKQEGTSVALFDTRRILERWSPGCFQIETTADVGVLEKLRIGVGFSKGFYSENK